MINWSATRAVSRAVKRSSTLALMMRIASASGKTARNERAQGKRQTKDVRSRHPWHDRMGQCVGRGFSIAAVLQV